MERRKAFPAPATLYDTNSGTDQASGLATGTREKISMAETNPLGSFFLHAVASMHGLFVVFCLLPRQCACGCLCFRRLVGPLLDRSTCIDTLGRGERQDGWIWKAAWEPV